MNARIIRSGESDVNDFLRDRLRRSSSFRLRLRAHVVLALTWIAATACSAAGPPAPWGVIVFPSGAEFGLEFAADDAARQRGYMGREAVGAHDGMLFVFDRSGVYPFWMKHCRVALDIIWLDDQLQVVDLSEATPPCPEAGDCPNVSPRGPARYVLEVRSGRASEEGLKRGDRLVLLGQPPQAR
jgi:uncharacterized protein